MEIVIETCLDSIKMLPFLFFAFLLIEFLEYYSGGMSGKLLKKVGKAGPVVGAVLGCVPQCGFSVLAANLYAGGILSAGTLIAVFTATSDEAVLILMANPGRAGEIIWLLAVKVVIAVAAGYFVDGVMQKYIVRTEKNVHIKTRETVRSSKMEVVREAIGHTFRIFIYLFVFNLILNFAIELLGIQKLSEILLGNTVFQPIIAAIIGLIPNCAASVILTQLYLSGAISFASVVSGLCTGAGVGLIVLFKMNSDQKENFRILQTLVAIASVAGMFFQFFQFYYNVL